MSKNINFAYKVNEVVKTNVGEITILGTIRKRDNSNQYKKYYKYRCNKCGFDCGEHYFKGNYIKEKMIQESHLKAGIGCPCCNNRICVTNINSIYVTDSWMIDIGVSEEDAKKYTKSTSVILEVKCPFCKTKKSKSPNRIYNEKSISCSVCGDNISYPEKFMNNILKQLGVEFETQYSPNYLERKLSDFYISSMKLVIETDGALGHKGCRDVMCRNGIEERISTDDWKDAQHRLHGVDTIRVNCFESDMEYIKNNILKSKLNELFDLSNIDWDKADLYAIKSNKVKEVCDCWNNKEDWETTVDIGIIFNCSSAIIRKRLLMGNKLGWCNYDGRYEGDRNRSKINDSIRKSILVVDISTKKEYIFGSSDDCAKQSIDVLGVKLSPYSIKNRLIPSSKYKGLPYKGYEFRYLEAI